MLQSMRKLNTILDTVAPKMDALNKLVHTEVISGDYLVKNSKKVTKAINKVLEGLDTKVLDKAVLGKLSYKLPRVMLSGEWNEADKVIATKITAGIVLQHLIDTNAVKTVTELIVKTEGGKKVFRKERFIMSDNELDAKQLLKGLHSEAGTVIAKAIKTKVGGRNVKHDAKQKEMLTSMATQRFILSDVASKDLLMKFYELGKGYASVMNGKSNEDPILMNQRYNKYADTIMDLEGKPFSLSNWMDARTRIYYDLVLEGISPQGKLFETLLIDSMEPYLIDEAGYKELVHILMVTLRGRMTMEEALKAFEADSDAVLVEVHDIDLMSSTSQDELGEGMLLKKLVIAYAAYKQGKPTHYIFGKDLTNSGLGVAGNSFRAPKMMEAANYGGLDTAVDSHTAYAKGFDMDRNDIKSLHTGLLHGSTFKAMAADLVKSIKESKFDSFVEAYGLDDAEDKFNETYSYITEEFVRNNSIESYGVEVLNIDRIASWGGDIINNNDTSLMWNTLDGMKAQSTAYMTKVPVTLYIVSTSTESGYARWNITCDLPIIISRKGEVVYGKDTGAVTKKRGLYANITHSVDAAILRAVYRTVNSKGHVMLMKHDDFMAPLNDFPAIRETIKTAMKSVYELNPYELALQDIKFNHSQYIVTPDLIQGNASMELIEASEHYLMP